MAHRMNHPARETVKLTRDHLLVALSFERITTGVRVARTFAYTYSDGERIEYTETTVERASDAERLYRYAQRTLRFVAVGAA